MSLSRTKGTDLTDDQLILLDALFDSRCPVAFLRRNLFCQIFNRREGHSLDDQSLDLVLDDMVKYLEELFAVVRHSCLSHARADANRILAAAGPWPLVANDW